MAGTVARANVARRTLRAHHAAATTAETIGEDVITFKGKIVGVQGYAGAVGAGAGDTVLDITVNGTSIWSVATNRPTLAAASSGVFASTIPIAAGSRVKPGDIVLLTVASISDTGHERVSLAATIEMQ